MQTIHVDPTAFAPRTFRSGAEAIAFELNSPRAPLAAMDSSRICGTFIEDCIVSKQRVVLRLSNGHFLDVTIAGGKVEWQILQVSTGDSTDVEHGYGPMQLAWPNGEMSIWDPAALVRSRRQFGLSKLCAGDAFFNVYFQRGGALQFLPLWNSSEQLPMLYVWELEPIPAL